MVKRTITHLVVSDSGPLISFARAGKLQIVQDVYGKIIIPPEVYNEVVVRGKGKPGAKEVENAAWISVEKPKNQTEVESLNKKLHLGESEAIVLAKELSATLLVDEKAIIHEARKQKIKITSTHLTLELAKKRGLIKSVKQELNELIAAGFRTTEKLIQNSLKKVGE